MGYVYFVAKQPAQYEEVSWILDTWLAVAPPSLTTAPTPITLDTTKRNVRPLAHHKTATRQQHPHTHTPNPLVLIKCVTIETRVLKSSPTT